MQVRITIEAVVEFESNEDMDDVLEELTEVLLERDIDVNQAVWSEI